jgi:hypothetical protein
MNGVFQALVVVRVFLKVASLACALGGHLPYALAAYVAADLFHELVCYLDAQCQTEEPS